MSSLADTYANQPIGWRRCVDYKDNGAAIYDPPRDEAPDIIYAQATYTRRLIRNAKGDEVISEGYLITSTPVNEGDMLIIDDREWTVQAAEPIRGLFGEELHREVYL